MTDDKITVHERLSALLEDSPFHKLLGLHLQSVDLEAQSVSIGCSYGPSLQRAPDSGQYHGGVIASLLDIAGDFALIAALGYGVPTINLRVDYLRPAGPGDLRATARVRRAGRTIGVVDIEILDSSGRCVALGRGCYGTQPG